MFATLNIVIVEIIIMSAGVYQVLIVPGSVAKLALVKCLEASAIVVILCGENKKTLEKCSHLPQINFCSRLALGLGPRDSARFFNQLLYCSANQPLLFRAASPRFTMAVWARSPVTANMYI